MARKLRWENLKAAPAPALHVTDDFLLKEGRTKFSAVTDADGDHGMRDYGGCVTSILRG